MSLKPTVLFLVVLATALAAAAADDVPDPVPFSEIEPIPLREAVKRGIVSARGEQPRSYKEITLDVRNLTRDRVVVDLCGSFLKPKSRGSCQRLGIGPPTTPGSTKRRGPGTVLVYLEPREREELRMNTVCLDAGRSSPGGQAFDVAREPLPEVRQVVMRWWADNPTAPQSDVNCAIWSNRDKVEVRPGVTPSYRRPTGKFPAVHGGTYYRLDEGELTSLGVDGVTRILGTRIFAILPADSAVYAIGLGTNRRPELWRLAVTGEEPWGAIGEIDDRIRIREVMPVSGGNLVFVTDQGVLFRQASDGKFWNPLDAAQVLDVSVRRGANGKIAVVLRVPAEKGYWQGGERHAESSDIFELWTLDAKTGKAERQKRFWNVKAAAIGPGGFFGLSHKGVLRRFAARSFKDVEGSPTHAGIMAVGRKTLWLVNADGKIVSADPRTGRIRFATDHVAGALATDIDPLTDDLAYVKDGKFYRIRAADGTTEEL